MKILINSDQQELLFLVKDTDRNKGGFQNLFLNLQSYYEKDSNTINLPDFMAKEIKRHVYSYQKGGWQNKLKKIFCSIL